VRLLCVSMSVSVCVMGNPFLCEIGCYGSNSV
jgi:hypothetical protein